MYLSGLTIVILVIIAWIYFEKLEDRLNKLEDKQDLSDDGVDEEFDSYPTEDAGYYERSGRTEKQEADYKKWLKK